MRSMISVLCLLVGMLIALPMSSASAAPPAGAGSQGSGNGSTHGSGNGSTNGSANGSANGVGQAPELDPTAAGAAVLLMVGGVLCLVSRRREGELS